MKALKSLIQQDPSFSTAGKRGREKEKVRHFKFVPIEGIEDHVTLPVCCTLERGVYKQTPHGVTCQKCLDTLDALALCEDYAEALAKITAICPEVITPDPEIAKQTHGGQPSREARIHIRATDFLAAHVIDKPELLPQRAIGSDERTFYLNMIETGLLNADGERSGLAAADLAGGKNPDSESDIFKKKPV